MEKEKNLLRLRRVITFLQKPVPFSVTALVVNVTVITIIYIGYSFLPNLPSSSALQILASIVESSATILAIFLALVTFLFRDPTNLKRMFARGDFFSACLTFSLSIITGLIGMTFIDSNQRVEGRIILAPVYLFFASLFFLFLTFYRVFARALLAARRVP